MGKVFISDAAVAWLDIVSLVSNFGRATTYGRALCKLCLSAAVYYLWWQRNALRHGSVPKSEEQLLHSVVWDVSNRINWKGKFCKSDLNIALCDSWGLGLDILHSPLMVLVCLF